MFFWGRGAENFDMRSNQLTKQGFMELNLMEATEKDGDPADLWVTLEAMGYNRMLELVEVSRISLKTTPRVVLHSHTTTSSYQQTEWTPPPPSPSLSGLSIPDRCTLWRHATVSPATQYGHRAQAPEPGPPEVHHSQDRGQSTEGTR